MLFLHAGASVRSLVKFVPAVVYHFCLNLPATFSQQVLFPSPVLGLAKSGLQVAWMLQPRVCGNKIHQTWQELHEHAVTSEHILHTIPTQHLSMFYLQPRCCEQQHIKSTYSQQCPHSTFYSLVINWQFIKLHIWPKPDLFNILPTLCMLKICFHV